MSTHEDVPPVPSGHAPRLETLLAQQGDRVTITVAERHTRTAWISMDSEDCIEIEQ